MMQCNSAASWLMAAAAFFLLTIAPATAAEPIQYGTPKKLCKLADDEVDESSGLAVSRRHKDVFFTHNDSGDDARIYAFDATGKDLGDFPLSDADANDWEDMASFEKDGKHYLLLGDVGDNDGLREHLTLYLVEEPALTDKRIKPVQTVHFRFEDGVNNCESVGYDPTTDEVILVVKKLGMSCKAYQFRWPEKSPAKPIVAKPIATLKTPLATAMDISPDGRRAVVLTYTHAYEYVKRDGEDWAKAFARSGRRIQMPVRIQGESICYGIDGKTLYLTSEKRPTPLFRVGARD